MLTHFSEVLAAVYGLAGEIGANKLSEVYSIQFESTFLDCRQASRVNWVSKELVRLGTLNIVSALVIREMLEKEQT